MIAAAFLSLILAAMPAADWSLKGNAHLVDDGGRPAVQVRAVSYYTNQAAGYLATKSFAPVLSPRLGQTLEFCVRARATKSGTVEVSAGPEWQSIPFPPSGRYSTRCVPFVVTPDTSVWVTNGGVEGNVTRIRQVFLREVG